MSKVCTRCKIEKDLSEFGRNKYEKSGYRFQCKQCRNEQIRTGKPNTGRFQKGQISLRKGVKLSEEQRIKCKEISPFKKGFTPWNKGRYNSDHRPNILSEWAKKVKERDGYQCKKCGSSEKLESHHIIAWKDNKDLRFDISNGITVCRSCHLKIEPRRKMKE